MTELLTKDKLGVTKKYGESSTDCAAYLFRKTAQLTTEDNLKPNMIIVHQMIERGLRVQDLLFPEGKEEAVAAFKLWYMENWVTK